MDSKEVSLIIKWSGKEFPIEDLTEHDTVAVLRHEICKKTQVRPERQKLLNLKYKGKEKCYASKGDLRRMLLDEAVSRVSVLVCWSK